MFGSIIIPTVNGKEYLKKTLDSLYRQEAINKFEVIVIANGSTDLSEKFIQNNYSNCKLVVNQKNMGSCFARNQGLAVAKGDWIAFMDCDLELAPGFLSSLTSVLINLDDDVAAISPKIIDESTNKIFSCGLFLSSLYRVYDLGRGKPASNYPRIFPIDGPNACCGIFKRSYLDKIKRHDYFDNDFFFLFEDAEIALRLKNKGYKSLFRPELTCYHQGGSSGVPKDKRRYFCFRNRIFMIINNNNFFGVLKVFTQSFIYDFFRTLHLFLTNKYAFKIFSDLIRKYRNEKLTNF